MIRLPRDMSQDDVSQWLNGGIFLVRTKSGKMEPVEWFGIEWPYVVGVSLFSDEVGRFSHTNCFAVWPELGSFNARGGYAVHIARRAERQYRRTFNSRCVDITVPWGYKVAHIKGTNLNALGSWRYAGRLPWTGVFPASFEEAEAWILEGKPTVAVNRHLVIAGDGNTEKRMIYLDGELAATVVGGELFPTCTDLVLKSLNKHLNGRYTVNA